MGGAAPSNTLVVTSLVWTLLTAMFMLVVNPEQTRDADAPCPRQDYRMVLGASLATGFAYYNVAKK